MVKRILCGLTADEVLEMTEPFGFNSTHSVSITNNLYKRKISDYKHFVKLPNKLRDLLEEISVPGTYPPVSYEISIDRSVKYLFRTDAGMEFETVFIPEHNRNTVCVSSQSGCRMGCSFCATGNFGFRGNLTTGDIINQIISIPHSEKITHVVFMGMGEPMDNLESVLKACKILISEWGLSLGSKNITVSSVGKMPELEKFLHQSECNLAFSLYSPFTDERLNAIPSEKKNPASKILDILKGYPVRKKRRFSVAYVMIRGINDSDKHLEELKSILKDSALRVNLLPYHSALNNNHQSSTAEKMQYFKHSLTLSGISTSIRKSRGNDISAACGLLAIDLEAGKNRHP